MPRIKVICSRSNELGFGLAGVETDTYRTIDEADGPLGRALDDTDLGVLLVDEALTARLDPRLVRRLEESDRPLVIPVPLGISEGAEREYVEQVIRRVIGYRVRLR